MEIGNIYFAVVLVTVLSHIEASFRDCGLNCGFGYRCVKTRSTCNYPPCPFVPTCIPEQILQSSVIVHPGQCPVETTIGPCVIQCKHDGDCRSYEKCCKNGCGKTCRSIIPVASKKTGTCPRKFASACTERCVSDNDCPGVEKCCQSSCGFSCTKPCYSLLRPGPMQRFGRSSIWKLPLVC